MDTKKALPTGAALSICMVFGIVAGAAFDNVPIGLAFGIIVGVVVAGAVRRRSSDDQDGRG